MSFIIFYFSIFQLFIRFIFRAFGFAGDKRDAGQASFVGADRDSGLDTDGGRGGDIVASLGRVGGDKRRRAVGRELGPDESPIMPDPMLLRRRLDFE